MDEVKEEKPFEFNKPDFDLIHARLNQTNDRINMLHKAIEIITVTLERMNEETNDNH